MKKKILILIVLVCSFFACFSVKTYASTDYRTKIGYFEYDFNNTWSNINLNTEMVDFVNLNVKRNIKDKNIMWQYRIFHYDGYLYNDLDSLIIVLEYLEGVAKEKFKDYDSNDLILSYIRSFNNSYIEGTQGFLWNQVAGEPNAEFANKIDELDEKRKNSIGIREYFNRMKDKGVNLIDPLNPYAINNHKSTEIDLIHMFAVMDAMYNNTGKNWLCRDSEYNDLCGWAGDLYTFTAEVKDAIKAKNSNQNNGNFKDSYESYIFKHKDEKWHIATDLAEYLGLTSKSFSNLDMLADIDGLNICRLFLNYDNDLSRSVSAYYDILDSDNSTILNRYSCFKEASVTSTYNNSFYKEGFGSLVKFMCGLKGINIVSINIARNSLSKDSNKDIFDKTSRLFISYIEEMAKGQPEEER